MNRRGNSEGEDRFRVRPGAPKQRGQAFVSQVLREASKTANSTGRKPGKTTARRLGGSRRCRTRLASDGRTR